MTGVQTCALPILAAHSTRIQWHHRFKSEAYSRRHHSSSRDFFRWFSDHSFAGSSRIAEVGCLWASSAMAMLFGCSGGGVWAWPGLASPDRAPFPYQIISEDLWPNPLRYYPREEGTAGTGK